MAQLIKSPIFWAIGLIVWCVGFSFIIGGWNSIFLNTQASGSLNGLRFDRVVVVTSDNTSDEAWGDVITSSKGGVPVDGLDSTTSYKVTQSGTNACGVGSTRTSGTFPATEAYTEGGTVVTIPAITTDGTTAPVITGCEWMKPSKTLTAMGFGTIIRLILQAVGLAPPVALMVALGAIGGGILAKTRQLNPIMMVVVAIVIVAVVAAVFGVFIGFLDIAFAALDDNRFVIYESGLGALGPLIGNFFGIVAAAGILTVGWAVASQMRQSNMSGSSLGGRM